MSQDLQPVAIARTPAQTAIHIATKGAIISALVCLWAIQYAAWVPLVWAWHTTVAIVRFATHSLGYIILLCIPFLGWLILAILLIRDNPNRIHADRTYLHPWFAAAIH